MTADVIVSKDVTPLQNESTNSIIETLIDHYIYTCGGPENILSGQESNFFSELMTQFKNALNIGHINTTEFHPQSNRNIERMHFTLVKLIKTSITENNKQWDENLKYTNFIIPDKTCNKNFVQKVNQIVCIKFACNIYKVASTILHKFCSNLSSIF